MINQTHQQFTLLYQNIQFLLKSTVELYLGKTQQQEPSFLDSNSLLSLPVQNPQQFLELVRKKYEEREIASDRILHQSIDVFERSISQIEEMSKHFYELEDRMCAQSTKYMNLQEELLQAKSQVQHRDEQLKRCQQQNSQLRARIQELYQNFELQRKQSRVNHENELKLQQLDIQAVKQLKQHHDLLQKQIFFMQENKEKIEEQLRISLKKIEVLDEELTKTNSLLDWERRKKQEVKETIEKKQQIIQRYEEQLESLNEALKNPYEQLQGKFLELQNYFIPPTTDTLNQKSIQNYLDKQNDRLINQENSPIRKRNRTLQQQTGGFNFNQYCKKSHSKQNVDYHELKVIESEKDIQSQFMRTYSAHTYVLTNIQKKLNRLPQLDPYYCHYVLLSQGIKIRENDEKIFNADIKPYYKQIINEKIPMHQWQSWILDKLQELAQIPISQRTISLRMKREEQINFKPILPLITIADNQFKSS